MTKMEPTPVYTQVGTLADGHPFWYAKGGRWAIEHDYQYLVEPTPGEMDEIWKLFPTGNLVEPNEIRKLYLSNRQRIICKR